jgi:integrase
MERLGPHDHLWYRGRYQPGDRRRRTDPIGDTTFEHWYKRGIEAAGVRYLNPHQTRHTYGWWLRNQGFTIEERQLLMGHENINTTQRFYDRTSIDDVADKMAAL